MDMHDEEFQAKFITGVDTTISILEAAIERLRQAKSAAVANRVVEATDHFSTTMDMIDEFIKASRKKPGSWGN
jgi:hypothetical protein